MSVTTINLPPSREADIKAQVLVDIAGLPVSESIVDFLVELRREEPTAIPTDRTHHGRGGSGAFARRAAARKDG